MNEETYLAFFDMKSAMETFYKDTKDTSFELFLSAISMLIERRCYEEGRDVIKTTEDVLNCVKKINEELGETDWHD